MADNQHLSQSGFQDNSQTKNQSPKKGGINSQ